MKSLLIRLALYMGLGAMIGAALGYVSQCSGGTCPLMCVWWRGAIVGAITGLVMCLAGSTRGSNQNTNDSNQPPVIKS